jgi:S1-C subfamily serine protease
VKHFVRVSMLSAVLGGLVVAGAFLALGITGRRTTQTIVEQSPIAALPASSTSSGLTPHDIYLRDAPGVVSVRAQIVQQVQNPFDLFPQEQRSEATGSGFLVRTDGSILTNYHVIQGADPTSGVTVQFEDNVTRKATVVGQDPSNDLALLKVDLGGVHARPLAMGESANVQVGDPTLAIGNPFGLDRTLTSGMVSALARQIQAPNGFSIDNVIQTDTPINPGNSGGPLIDAAGRVIGINSQIATGGNGSGSVGIAFAVPIDTARRVLNQLERGGQVKLAYLGIGGVGASGARRGVFVQRADTGGPAAIAGLAHGDVIEKIDQRAVTNMAEVQTIVAAHQPGQDVKVSALRAGRLRVFTVRLAQRPLQAPTS